MSRGSWRVAAVAGLCLGAASLTRPVALYLPLVLVPFFLVTAASRRHVLAFAVALGLSGILPAAWVARNVAVAGIPDLATIGVFNLAHFRAAGVLAEVEGISIQEADARISERVGRTMSTADDYTRTRTLALEILRAHPRELAGQIARSSAFQIVDPGGVTLRR
jgi:hypothetical protein